MRFWTWFFRPRSVDAGLCATCGSELTVCPNCRGNWQGQHCQCGLGHLCRVHGRHHR